MSKAERARLRSYVPCGYYGRTAWQKRLYHPLKFNSFISWCGTVQRTDLILNRIGTIRSIQTWMTGDQARKRFDRYQICADCIKAQIAWEVAKKMKV